MEVFYKLPARLAQAEYITKIEKGMELSLSLDIYHKITYCYLLSSFNYNRSQSKQTRFTYNFIALKCGISESSVKRRIKELKEFGIIDFYTYRTKAGDYSPCVYNRVNDIVTNDKYKLHNPKLAQFFNDKRTRKVYLSELFNSDEVDKSWNKRQYRFFWANRHYELITGKYLKGDKTKDILYDNKMEFSMSNSLRDSDIDYLNSLLDNQVKEPA